MISIGGCTNDKRGVSGSPLEVMLINSKTYKDRDNDNNNYNDVDLQKCKENNNNDNDKIRLEICRDRRDRRSCKIFPSCVKFWGNNANSLGNYRVFNALNE